jgi:hypothetical protein
MRVLSLGAGVQSTTLLLMAAENMLEHQLDVAIFADTGYEPQAVYDHLDKIEREIAEPAGIPIYRVSAGNIREDALSSEHGFASMPLFVRKPDGSKGMARRQCTNEYKVAPIKRKIRELLGAEVSEAGVVGRVKKGKQVEQWIGISLDELHRAKNSDVNYIKNVFPLLDKRMTRKDCLAVLEKYGFGQTPKSACIACPFRTNEQWRDMKNNDPDEFLDAVNFDKQMREFHADQPRTKNNLFFLHKSFVPLDEADLSILSRKEIAKNQQELFTCSPFSCNGDETSYGIEVFG